MRKVVKAVFRSLSATAATNVSNLESQIRPDIAQHIKRKDINFSDNHTFSTSSGCRDMSRSFEVKLKTDSLSPIYKLTEYEKSCFEELQDKECDYYPNNSIRGDVKILNMATKNNISDDNVNSTNIMLSLKNIRFVNSIVFSQDGDVFLTTANYIQRLLHTKAVKKELMQFICAAMYDIALERKVAKALTKDRVALLLSLTNIPINHIEDFSRMKALLLKQLNYDLETITIVDYLQILLKFTIHADIDNLPESHSQLLELACILACSCELSHFSLACQSISLISIAARHVSFDSAFSQQFAHVIDKFPMIFTSPVRLTQFAKLDNVCEKTLKQCTESLVRFIAKYYDNCQHQEVNSTRQVRKNMEEIEVRHGQLETVMEETEDEDESKEDIELFRFVSKGQQNFDVDELMDKLRRVSLAINSQINGKQKQRHKRLKKKLSRQLNKCGRSKLDVGWKRSLLAEDEDSAISSSSSDLVSPTNSPVFHH